MVIKKIKPRRPTVAFCLKCLESDEDLVLLYMSGTKDIIRGLRKDGVSEYYLQKITKLIHQGEGMGHKAKPWLEVRRILVKYR
jgi:hypothetical protein